MVIIRISGRGIAEGEIAAAKTNSNEIDISSSTFKLTLMSVVRRYPPAFVEKVGAVTGYTSGEVVQHCFDSFRTGEDGREIVFVCQQVASYGSSGGDSGSPVFSPDTKSDWSHYDRASIWEGIHSSTVVDQSTGDRYSVYSPLIGFQMDLEKQCEETRQCYRLGDIDWWYRDAYYGTDY